jgi:hypothetical protein
LFVGFVELLEHLEFDLFAELSQGWVRRGCIIGCGRRLTARGPWEFKLRSVIIQKVGGS